MHSHMLHSHCMRIFGVLLNVCERSERCVSHVLRMHINMCGCLRMHIHTCESCPQNAYSYTTFIFCHSAWRRCMRTHTFGCAAVGCSGLQCVAVGCSGLQWVVVGCSVSWCVDVLWCVDAQMYADIHIWLCCSVLQWVAVCCSVLQWIAVCCSVLQCIIVCRRADICRNFDMGWLRLVGSFKL